MEKEKFQTKKSLGQHFLTSAIVPAWMCDAAQVSKGDVVVEIGPGTGVLTKELLLRGAQVIALEADIRAIEVLTETFTAEIAEKSLILQHIDARTMDLSKIAGISDHSFKVVANIPYYLSGFLFRIFLESKIQPKTLVYLVQKEVAKRITSQLTRGEKESILSLSIKAYGEVTYIKTVSRGHFAPPPKVDSAIVAIHSIHRDRFAHVPESFFLRLLHLGFGQKRKQLLGNFSKQFERNTLTNIFSTLSIPLSTRAEDLSIEIWLELVTALYIHTTSTGSSQTLHS